jgi:uncharacterized protein (DUF1330 family)
MSSYAVAHLRWVDRGPDIVRYLETIDAALRRFGGRFIIHGGSVDIREGNVAGDIIAIEFPDRARAQAWYESEALQEIVPLRTKNSEGWVILLDGVTAEHRATDILAA